MFALIAVSAIMGCGTTQRHYSKVVTDPSPTPAQLILMNNYCEQKFPGQVFAPNKPDTVIIIDTALNNSLNATIRELNEYILATSMYGPVDSNAVAAIIRTGIKPTFIKTTLRITDSVKYVPRETVYKLAAFELNAREDAKSIDKLTNERDGLKSDKQGLLKWLIIGWAAFTLLFAWVVYSNIVSLKKMQL